MRKQSRPWLFALGPVALFAGIIIRAIYSGTENFTEKVYYLSLSLLGFGISLSLVGIIFFIVTMWMKKKNPQKAKQIEVEAKDERNVKLLEKSGYITWYVTMLTLVALNLTFVALGLVTAMWLSLGVFIIHVSAFFICGYIYSKKY